MVQLPNFLTDRQTDRPTYLPYFLLRHPKFTNKTAATDCATQFRDELTYRATKFDRFIQL